MSYVERRHTIGDAILRGLGLTLLILFSILAALLAYLWAVGGSVEYEMIPRKAASSAEELRMIKILNGRVGCELWGKPINTGSGWIARFRFPNEIEANLVDCLRRASQSEFDIRKASWLQTKLHQPKPVWF